MKALQWKLKNIRIFNQCQPEVILSTLFNFYYVIVFTHTDPNITFIAEIVARCLELKQGIDNGNYSYRPKSNVRTSLVWNVFNEIVDDKGMPVNNFFYCTKCHNIKQCTNATTTQLLRHSCVRELMPNNDRLKFDQEDRGNLKTAAAKFVCLDLRPFHAVECLGFQEILMAGVKLGQKYPDLKREDLVANMPGRMAVENTVIQEALDSKEHMKHLLRKSINSGGLGCTLDLWTDKFKHNTYMAITANFDILQETHIEKKRIVFYMGNITEIVKSKAVIKSKIVEIFDDFGITEAEIRDRVVFTTDR